MSLLKPKFFLIAFICLYLISCAIAPTQSSSFLKNYQQRKNIKNYSVQGQVGILSTQYRMSGQFYFKQCGNHYDLQLFGPLGAGRTRLYGDKKHAVLITDQGKSFQAKDPQQLLQHVLNMNLPANDLPQWLIGVPTTHQSWQLDSSRANQFLQNGWRISYQDIDQQSRIPLPSKISFTREDWLVKMVINKWQLLDEKNC